MSDVQQPVADRPVVEDAPAAQTTESTAPAASSTLPIEAVPTEAQPETTATEAPKTEAGAVEGVKEPQAEKAKVEAEPVFHGALGYKGGRFPKSIVFSKNYFWFGDEAIPQQHMDKFMRGEKPETSYPTTAWASHTGKGLFLFAKHSDQMKTPDGAINLADVSDIAKEGTRDFSFKYHGNKHTFQASNEKERDGWLVAVEQTAEEAKSSKEGILNSDKYKDTIGKLNKPATLATGAAAAATAKKSTDTPTTTDETTEDRKDSSEADDGKKKSKSRSVSRGNKRSSLFGSLMGKKEERDEQKELKAEEKAEVKAEKKAEKEEKKEEKEEKKEEEKAEKEEKKEEKKLEKKEKKEGLSAVDGAASDDKKITELGAEKNTTDSSKPAKRTSIFGSFFEKVRSPTSEKKEADVGPVPPPKDDAPPVLPPTDSTDEAPPAPPKDNPEEAAFAGVATGAATGVAAEETKDTKNEKATTPGKEKENFFKRFLSDSKIKTHKPEAAKDEAKEGAEAAAAEEPAKEIEPTDAAVADKTTESAAETPAKPTTEPLTTTTATGPVEKKDEATTPNTTKRTSIFGTLKGKVRDSNKGDKSDAEKSEGEEKKSSNKLGGIFRNPSKAIKSTVPTSNKDAKKDEAAAKSTTNGDKAADVSGTETATAADAKPTEATPAVNNEAAIGDVVPEAVSVGQPQEQQGAPVVQATA
ncbi:MAG: hypothetical protein M1822_003975 [Bathelium mastoideum]|nr:MAG: hypothetical protein M1822_003975 [Bathelium mastoideum]